MNGGPNSVAALRRVWTFPARLSRVATARRAPIRDSTCVVSLRRIASWWDTDTTTLEPTIRSSCQPHDNMQRRQLPMRCTHHHIDPTHFNSHSSSTDPQVILSQLKHFCSLLSPALILLRQTLLHDCRAKGAPDNRPPVHYVRRDK